MLDGDSRTDIYVVLNDGCVDVGNDAPDAIFHQLTPGQWTMERLQQPFGGCGSLATAFGDAKVLLANGSVKAGGPNYVLTFGPNQK